MILDVLETLVGFLTVVLLLSVAVTALTQATQAVLRLRGRNLRRGLELMLRHAMIAVQEVGSEKPVGLLVVHGMGKQKEGETRDSVVRGLRKAYPDARFDAHGKYTEMVYEGCSVRIYEVYWAPVLMGERIYGSFSIQSIHEFVWFPSLNNLEKGSVHQEVYNEKLVKWWHRRLLPLGMFTGSIYYAIKWPLFGVGWVINLMLSRSPSRRVKPESLIDNWLAERIGDVFNYVNAYVGSMPHPAGNPVPCAPQEIYNIFRERLEAATRECREIQILGHSMGTVIVHHALTRFSNKTRKLVAFSEAERQPGRPPLTRIYSIGSPLEKIRFFWPKVVLENDYNGDFEWLNFKSRADVIAGTLRRFGSKSVGEVQNHDIRGAGGLITAHNGYRSHPSFLSKFGSKLTGIETPIQPSSRWRWLQSFRDFLESFIAGSTFVVLGIVGALIFFAMGYLSAQIFLQFAQDEFKTGSWVTPNVIAITSGFVLTSVMIIFAPIMAKKYAQEIHNRHWQTLKQ